MNSLQQLLHQLPSLPQSPVVGYVALVVAAAGIVLWLFGSRFGRSLLTLAGVAGGTALGLRVPGWFSLTIQNRATAVAGALVLGLAGYLLHRVIARVGLSLLLAVWAAIACWMLIGPNADWKAPELTEKVVQHDPTAMQEYVRQFWQSLPADLANIGPIAIGAALLGGVLIGAFLGRLAMAMFYSVLGTTLTLGAALLAAMMLRPQLLDAIPAEPKLQLGVLLGAAVLGTLIQWAIAPRAKRAAAPPPEPEPEKPAAQPAPPPPPPLPPTSQGEPK